jgi:hypothetical protein
MIHYRDHFRGARVLLPCNDHHNTEFIRYFTDHMVQFGICEIVSVGHASGPTSPFVNVVTECGNRMSLIEGDGDFRSPECVALLQEADIVVTNPPFSLFREFISLMMEHDKKFIVLGNVNAISYKECFELFQSDRMWLGQSIHSGDREFRVPDSYDVYSPSLRVDSDGNKYVRVNGVRWFTNLDIPKRHEVIYPVKKYRDVDYPTYDNLDAIEVSRVVNIPEDWDGFMGVPITFLDKYNPRQFEIVGLDRYVDGNTLPNKRMHIGGKEIYARVIIRKRKAI